MADVRVNFDLQKIERARNLAIVEGLNASQLMLSEYVRQQLSKPGTGRLYRVNKGKVGGRNLRERRQRIGNQIGGYHQASAPGFPPAANTKRLAASWMVSGINKRNPYGGYASLFRAPGAFVLDRFKPRPYLRPVLPIASSRVGAIFEKAMKRHFGA